MIELKRKVNINWKLHPTAFKVINAKTLVSEMRPLGSSVSAISNILSQESLMLNVMPSIIGVSPNSQDWQNKINNYWESFDISIPKLGKTLNTSLMINASHPARINAIDELLKKLKINATSAEEKEKAVVKYLSKLEKPELEEDLYGMPSNTDDYLIWRFVLNYSAVANTPEDANKSQRIIFYLVSDVEIQKQKDRIEEIQVNATMALTTLLSSKTAKSDMNDIIIYKDLVTSIDEFDELSPNKRTSFIINLSTTHPVDFIEICNNKNIKIIAEAKKFVMLGFLNKIPNTNQYVDASDLSKIIGNNEDEVVLYFSNKENEEYLNSLRVKANQLLKK